MITRFRGLMQVDRLPGVGVLNGHRFRFTIQGMVVGSMEIQLRLEGCNSLKDKRRILRSLTDRLRREFGVAIAEVDDQDLWGNATVGVACVSNDARHAESVLQHVLDVFDDCPVVAVDAVAKSVERA